MLSNQPYLFIPPTTFVSPKPFIKWAGGKSQLLEQFTPYFPKEFSQYLEPFTGSAAVYWYLYTLREKKVLKFNHSRLTDSNAELINCYIVVRDDLNQLIKQLTLHRKQHEKSYFYKIRALNVNDLSIIDRAARFIYLNKTCFNGLYRVNRSGHFNVPIGSYENPGIFKPEELEIASKALQGVDLAVADFRDILNWAKKGDFIYFDPPYAPVSITANFTSYTKNPFGENEQKALAILMHELHQRGCKVMLSNSWVDSILELYKDFNCHKVSASRVINSNAEKRGKISELLVTNYDVP